MRVRRPSRGASRRPSSATSPPSGLEQAGQHRQQRALAAARRADHRDDLARARRRRLRPSSTAVSPNASRRSRASMAGAGRAQTSCCHPGPRAPRRRPGVNDAHAGLAASRRPTGVSGHGAPRRRAVEVSGGERDQQLVVLAPGERERRGVARPPPPRPRRPPPRPGGRRARSSARSAAGARHPRRVERQAVRDVHHRPRPRIRPAARPAASRGSGRRCAARRRSRDRARGSRRRARAAPGAGTPRRRRPGPR